MSGPFGSSQWMYKSGDYEIANSLRFEDGDSAYLYRTPDAGNRKTWTFSAWIKRGNLGIDIDLLHAYADSGERSQLVFAADDTIKFDFDDYTANRLTTTQVFRDASAWYHIVLAVDTTQGTAANRVKIYVNGNQITDFSAASYPSQNEDGHINSAIQHEISSYDGSGGYLDGYLAEVNFIEGAAKVPADFGETGDYGEWKPKKYGGAYGDEGFYLDFKSSGVGTAGSGTVGADRSGNGNHWTSSGLAATDQMIDTPTNNFCTANAIDVQTANKLKEGALQVEPGNGRTRGTMAVTSGKWYFEVLLLAQTSSTVDVGISGVAHEVGTDDGNEFVRIQHPSNGGDSVTINIGGSTTAEQGTVANGNIIGCFFDMAAEEVSFLVNNSAIAASCTGVDFSGLTNKDMMVPIVVTGGGRRIVCNFGQDSSFSGNKTAGNNADGNGIGDFFYAPPSGFLALCASNLPEPAVIPSEHFNTILYTGDDQTGKAISGVGFAPDFLWFKERNNTAHHVLHDSVRGVSAGRISSNRTNAEDAGDSIASFDSDGFTVGSSAAYINSDSANIVAWSWKANGSGAANTEGSINTTKTSANVDSGFSIMTYTGNATEGATLGHGLNKAPEMIWVKTRASGGWMVFHSGNTSEPATEELNLEVTEATQDSANIWNDTAPAATVFSLGNNGAVNGNGTAFVAYCFHSVEGYCKVGRYQGNNNANGEFVNTGFRPAFVMTKQSSTTGDWTLHDSARDIDNPLFNELTANESAAEGTSDADMDFTANGFKIRRASGQFNANNANVVYLAFAETPFKYANGR